MPRIVTCKGCGAKKKYYARSLCQACYNKAHHKHYYEANREAALARAKAYYWGNRDAIRSRDKIYRERNHERIKAQKAAYHNANRETINRKNMILSRLKGVMPQNRNIGKLSQNWSGGRIVFCDICGTCAGWRGPSKIKRNRTFRCTQHHNVKLKNGQFVFCAICGADAGYRCPWNIAHNKTGFRCKEHRYVRFKQKERNDEHTGSTPLRSSVA